MPDKKITELTAYVTPIATDVLPIVDVTAGATKKISVSNLTADKITANTPITPATKTKITYDADGLVTSGADANLDDLGDAEITLPADGDVLRYENATSKWKNSTALVDHIADTANPHNTSDANLVTSDITTNNATITKHGFLPKLSGSTNQYLNGAGNYVTISGTGVPSGYNGTTFTGQTTVNVVHNFGIKPLVQVLISNAVSIPYTITHNTDNDFTVTFSSSTSGTILSSVGSPQIPNVTTTAVDYTITTDDNIVIVTALNKTITLPTAVGITGKTYTIDNNSAGDIFVTGTGGQTIQGVATQTVPSQSAMIVYSTGAVWRIT